MSESYTAQIENNSIEEDVKTLTTIGSWSLTNEGRSIERALKFRTFKAAWAFMDAVAVQCKSHRHHPEWSNVYNQVYVRWTTHSANALTEKDVAMARICDEISQRAESEVIEEEKPNFDNLEKLANDVTTRAGDCCKK